MPAETPEAAFAGLPSADESVRTVLSSLSAASTALSVMWPTLPSSSLTWSSVVEALPSIGTTSFIVCSSVIVARENRPPSRTSM